MNLDQPQELAFVDQRIPVAVSIRQRGHLGDSTTLRLLLAEPGSGDAARRSDARLAIAANKLVEKREVRLKADAAVEEVFYVSHKKSGLYRYEISADGLPGEVTTANNTAPLLLRVVDQPVRVLLLEGKPYWDTKFLVRTLSADGSIELTSVVQLVEGRLWQRKMPRQAPSTGESRERRDAAPPRDAQPGRAAPSGSSGRLPKTPGGSSPTRRGWPPTRS